MIPATFEYEVAESVEDAVRLLGSREDAKLLAGGHSLLPLMKLRFAQPSLLVDIGRLAELAYVRDLGDHLGIGSLTRYHDLERDPLLREHCPIVAHVSGLVGDPQVRHRGTIGGSVAHGDPAGDLPTVLLALDAELLVRGPGGERAIPAGEFFRGLFETALGAEDVLTQIRVPKLGANAGWSYQKFTRRAQDWAIVGVAAVARRDNGAIGQAAVGLTNMGPTPLRARSVEEALAGGSGEAVAGASERAADGTSPPSDPNGSAEYRQHLARVLVRRALEEALAR
jgi:aerobic carbon-monoxide dehydrogenase medium subunit